MANDHLLRFDNLHLDLANASVWRGEQPIQLTPKAFDLLRYLAERAGQLVTKDELLNAVWQGVIVSENVLTTHVNAIRQALGDNAKAPRYLETVHRRGYRFVGKVVSSQDSVVSSFSSLTSNTQPLAPIIVGRDAELAQLQTALRKALNGERQMVFVTGEAGIGKTTVVEAFLAGLPAPQEMWLGQGQCIEQFGPGEAYLPLLSAFGQLGRASGREQILAVLQQYAPIWLVQMPGLLQDVDIDALQRKTAGATRERMLREMAEALEALTAVKPLVLVLEDLHWSDPSTLELLSFVARRRQAARLLVIGSYRRVEVLANGHPLRAVTQELQLHHHCEELPLRLLSAANIAQYLVVRVTGGVSGQSSLPELARLLHQRTEGNALFMVNVVEDLLTRGTLGGPEIAVSTPTTIHHLIERQFDHLTPAEQAVLAAASVAGVEFSAAAVAAGVEESIAEIETCCDDLGDFREK